MLVFTKVRFHSGAGEVQSELESKEMLSNCGVMSKGYGSHSEEVHSDQTWDDLNTEKNDYECNTLNTKKILSPS